MEFLLRDFPIMSLMIDPLGNSYLITFISDDWL